MKAHLNRSLNKAIPVLCCSMPALMSLTATATAAIDCILPPALSAPMVFDGLCPGDAGFPSDLNAKGKDVYVKLPTNRVCGRFLSIGYARNVRIFGGEFKYTDSAEAVITVRFTSGITFIDGVNIDVNRKSVDAIRVHHHIGRMIIQNSFFKGMTGVPSGLHGDVLQAQADGPLQELTLQNVTAMTGYQGLFTPYRPNSGDGTHALKLDRINFSYDPSFSKTSGAKKPLMLLYLGSADNNYDRVPDRGTTLSNVFVDTSYWSGFHYSNAIYAKPVAGSSSCATFDYKNKISGQACGGKPPGGDFAPAGKVGRTYKRTDFCKQ